MIYYQGNLEQIINGDCRDMSDLPDNSVQCVVTSPPYWGLRKYAGIQDLIWGDNHCEHKWGSEKISKANDSNRGTMEWATGGNPAAKVLGQKVSQGSICSLCGVWKGQYGLEPTPEMYIEHTIEILREIRRVLRKDGVVFWNIGDSYTASGGTQVVQTKNASHGLAGYRHKTPKLKPKDLCLIPFKVAIAAQGDGWWVRSVIIWSKPNPMPESVTDRPTESHEYILMLTKSKKYYWDADAVREPYSPTERWGGDTYKGAVKKGLGGEDAGLDRERSVYPNKVRGLKTKGAYELSGQEKYHGQDVSYHPLGRNIRSVWEFPTQPYPEAHFAVFPEKLPELCIKAATPEVGCCSKCGSPWERITKVSRSNESYWGKQGLKPEDVKGIGKYGDATASDGDRKRVGSDIRLGPTVSVETLGWKPTCKCNADKVPSLCLDPFLGAGTTLWVAKLLGRRAVGYELSEEYCALSLERNRQSVMELKV